MRGKLRSGTMSEKARVLGTAGGALGLGVFGAALGACCGFPWAGRRSA